MTTRSGRWRSAAFVLLCLAQLAAPAWMIAARERVLREGQPYRFRTEPVDPYDAFRGRYVALGFDAAAIRPAPAGEPFETGDRVYGVIEVGPDGYARFARLTTERPDAPHVQARVMYATSEELRLDLPFDRFYLDERLAPEAERVLRDRAAPGALETYAAVRVLDGRAVLEELWVGGRTVRDYVEDVGR